MEDIVASFLQAGTAYLALACVIGTQFLRTAVEIQFPGLKQIAHENDSKASYGSKGAEWWNKVALYMIAPAIGALLGMVKIDLIHADLEQMASRMLFGLVVGYFSRDLFKIFKAMMSKKTGVDLSSSPPGP